MNTLHAIGWGMMTWAMIFVVAQGLDVGEGEWSWQVTAFSSLIPAVILTLASFPVTA